MPIDVNEELLQAVLGEIRDAGYNAEAWTLDLLDRAAIGPTVDAIAAHFGSIDILINNAGISIPAPLDADHQGCWDKVLGVLITAQTPLCRAVLPHMREGGWGRIVNIA